MGKTPYEPYYLHQSHHLNRHQPLAADYYYQDEIRNPNLVYTGDTSAIPMINIPKQHRHIHTLFVSGLPDDIMPREIHNLFRRRPGFDSCQLKFTGRGNQVVAFVTFHSHQAAVMALQALDGVKFDPQTGSVLHIELARSNSRRKHKPGSGPYVVIDKRKKDVEDTSSDDGNESDDQHRSEEDPVSSNKNTKSTVKSEEKKVQAGGTAKNEPTGKASQGDPRPCSTLFIANLGPNCSEDELRQALSEYSGFNGLKMRSKGGMPVAFADFEEVEQATSAMEGLQGSMLSSSDRGGMLIEYARSKMRKP